MARESRRITLWVPLPLFGTLQERAQASKLGVSHELRYALERGLAQGSAPATIEAVERVELIATAALIAAEHNGRFLARTFPDGERRSLDLRESAVDAAERRLEECRVRVGEPEGGA